MISYELWLIIQFYFHVKFGVVLNIFGINEIGLMQLIISGSWVKDFTSRFFKTSKREF